MPRRRVVTVALEIVELIVFSLTVIHAHRVLELIEISGEHQSLTIRWEEI